MRFLVDQPVSPRLAAWLTLVGHDAFHVRDRGLSAAKDERIFSVAAAEHRIIITADLDFSRILAVSGRDSPGLILFRAGNITDDLMLALLRTTLERVPAEQLEKSIAVVERHAIRVAPLPIKPTA